MFFGELFYQTLLTGRRADRKAERREQNGI